MFTFCRNNIILCIIINAILLTIAYHMFDKYEIEENNGTTKNIKAMDSLDSMWKSLNDINPLHVKSGEVKESEKLGIVDHCNKRSIDNLDQNTLNALLNVQTNGLPNSFITDEIENIQSIQNGKGVTVHMSTQFADYTIL